MLRISQTGYDAEVCFLNERGMILQKLNTAAGNA
jgi:hypothetical protein